MFFLFNRNKINSQILSLGETLVNVHLEKLCLFWSIQFHCRGERNRKLITSNNNNCPPPARDFDQKAKSRGGTLVTRAYIKVAEHS